MMALRDTPAARWFYRLLEARLIPRLARLVRSPTQLTVAGLLMALLVPWGFALHPAAGLVLLLLSGLADASDGTLARWRGMESAWGAFLDSTLDRISDQFYLAGFWVLFWPLPHLTAASATLFGAALISLLISYTKARAAALGATCPGGLMDRGMRSLYLIVWALLICLLPGRREALLWLGLLLFVGLLLLTLWQRIAAIRDRLAAPPRA
jgi:phosphatidylglycerophosphate synthase